MLLFDPPGPPAEPLLYVTGGFDGVDGESSQCLATWGPDRPAEDVTGDCLVDVVALLELLSQWGPCPGCDCAADLDGDCAVGIVDFLLLLAGWS